MTPRLFAAVTTVTSFVLALAGLAAVAVAQDGEARSTDLACPPAVVAEADFEDVPDGAVHGDEIDCIVWWEVARGTSSTTYSPAAPVTRAQMASFIANLISESGGSLASDSADHFDDDGPSVHQGNINRLAETGVVAGKGDRRYDPSGRVSREQMATFLVNAYEYRTDRTLTVSRDYFDDDGGSAHEGNINKAAEAGFTDGTSAGSYSPGANVTRAQMASFLARVLDLLVEEGYATPPLVPTPTPSPTESECDPLVEIMCEPLPDPEPPVDLPATDPPLDLPDLQLP